MLTLLDAVWFHSYALVIITNKHLYRSACSHALAELLRSHIEPISCIAVSLHFSGAHVGALCRSRTMSSKPFPISLELSAVGPGAPTWTPAS